MKKLAIIDDFEHAALGMADWSSLQRDVSIAVFHDHLADEEFPVHEVTIVGVDLMQVERVTGRLTWPKVLLGGLATGAWLGLFIGLLLGMIVMFTPTMGMFGAGSAVEGQTVLLVNDEPITELAVSRARQLPPDVDQRHAIAPPRLNVVLLQQFL